MFIAADHVSLVQPLLERVRHEPERVAVILIENDGSETSLTVGQLHSGACAFAQALHALGTTLGDIVLIALPHSRSVLFAFWGTLYTGATASIVPYQFPRINPVSFGKQMRTLVERSGARAVITGPEYHTELERSCADLNCRVLNHEEVSTDKHMASAFQPKPRSTSGEQIAYLQYTSGTTGLQKGVMLSHRAILHFIPAIANAFGMNTDDVMVNWTPLYHDGGLFVGFIMPLLVGIPAVMMSAFKWIRSPKTFFWAIHQHRGTVAWMPNSAFNHALHGLRERDLEGVDLSSLRFVLSGGETIFYTSQQKFFERFGCYGFPETALATGYGFAENITAVTISQPGTRAAVDWVDARALQQTQQAIPGNPEEPGTIALVSCGRSIQGTEFRILDDSGQELPERHVGEIVVQSDCLFHGYHGRPDLTAQAFQDGWFYTGDLGYIAEGQLYVCGRKKDLIITGARNIYPDDLEALATTVLGIAPERAVAFGIPDEILGAERVVLVCELPRTVTEEEKRDLERTLRQRIFQEFDLTVDEVHLLSKRWIAKTPNGKIARGANRAQYHTLGEGGAKR
ncbi:AMP-binding protein [candidate division KSB3 bacterium]|uniref:AMP-binding protein n=1 Tax=candidate division KSB3 bacterium TaxID=2044937 RepID=A0A9D5JWJ6_9BACT|nr:AMP-binding protein [candidate division KSB3 bacterium]MBD3325443.1 AMP-binding protein [candidate division KSB3 bacterium]